MSQGAALHDSVATAAPAIGLAPLLAAAAARDPARLALADPVDKARWCGRPPLSWTTGTAHQAVRRLAAALRRLGLPPGCAVGLYMPAVSEAALALLASESAGLLPCLLPMDWDDDRLRRAAEAAQLRAVLTIGQFGEARPAEAACRLALSYYGLRFVAAFGPSLPDGVMGLDRAVLDHEPEADAAPAARGVVTFLEGDPTQPVHRDADALAAAAALHLVGARIDPGEHVVSLLPQTDLRGLVPGLVGALIAGASFEAQPLPDGRSIAAALERSVGTHLVAPDWAERTLAGATMPAGLRSLTLVRRAPCALPDAPAPRVRTLDAVVFGETAFLSARRDHRALATVLAAPERLAGSAGLIGVRRDPAGRLAFRGPAARAAPLRRSETTRPGEDEWVPSRFRVEATDGRATTIEAIGG